METLIISERKKKKKYGNFKLFPKMKKKERKHGNLKLFPKRKR